MVRGVRRGRRRLMLAGLLWLLPLAVSAQPSPMQAAMDEARRQFDAFEYLQVISILDPAITSLEAAAEPDADLLAQAFEMRGRAHYDEQHLEQAQQDFERLLRLRPDHVLPAGVSPRLEADYREIKARIVGFLALTMPRPAEISIDGRVYQVGQQELIELAAGDHEFVLRQPGYRDEIRPLTIVAGEIATLAATMERISGTLSVVTVPPGAEVTVDDTPRGVTAPARDGAPESQPLLVDGLLPGEHRLALRLDCHRPYDDTFTIPTPPTDLATGEIGLGPAVAMVSVETDAADATLFVDGEPRGLAPAEVTDLCAGEHVIEVRAPRGRFVDRRVWDAGDMEVLQAELRPAFAIVEVAGAPPRAADLATLVETALAGTRGILVYAPARAELERAAADERLDVSLAGPEATVARRGDLAGLWSERLGSQGVAWLTPVDGEADTSDLHLLARDSGTPDIVRLAPGDIGSRARAERRLSLESPPTTRTTIQATVVDVADLAGAAVIAVDPGGVGEAAGLQPGDRIVAAGASAIVSAADLAAAISAAPGGRLALAVEAEDGAARDVDVEVALVPDTVPLADETLLYNRLLLDLEARAAAATGEVAHAGAQLGLAVAHIRLENWTRALRVLESVSLPPGPGVSAAAVDYLTGVCLTQIGELEGARAALSRAAEAESATLSVGGPSIPPLARRELAALP